MVEGEEGDVEVLRVVVVVWGKGAAAAAVAHAVLESFPAGLGVRSLVCGFGGRGGLRGGRVPVHLGWL